MLIMEAGNIKKYYSDRLIIEFDSLKIYSGDKIGIVGQNGSGKTTLMNILSGDVEPDEGFVKQHCDIAYIRQFDKEFNLSQSINQEAQFPQKTLSGGEITRIKIANAFSNEHLLVFADEPTANLDYKGIGLLRQKLQMADSLLLISHDRYLLDSLCNKIIEVKDGRLKTYDGNYSFYKERSELELQRMAQEYEEYVSERLKLKEAIIDRRNKSRSIRKAPKRMGNSEARLHKRSANEKREKVDDAANQLKSRLQRLEVKQKPRELPKIRLDFSMTDPPQNKIVISAESLSFSYGNRTIFDNASFRVCNGMKTALWGENGSGKTTLLNLIARNRTDCNDQTDCNDHTDGNGDGNGCSQAVNIRIVPKARTGYFYQGFENLDHGRSVLENVMMSSVQTQTVVRTILGRLLISGDDVYKNVGVLSGGERIKVSFAKLFVSDANVLMLDEPTNYLDMMSIEALQEVLREYEGTILFVSHDIGFVSAVADKLLVIENHEIKERDIDYIAHKKSG